jgi:hypothetical protein
MFCAFVLRRFPLDLVVYALLGVVGLSFFVWIIQAGIVDEAENEARKKIRRATFILPKQFFEGSVARLFDSLLNDLYHRIREIYPEVPEDKIAKFLSEVVKEAGKIEEDDEMVRRVKIEISFKRISHKHNLPLILSIRMADTLKMGACFYLFSIRRPDADEVAVLKQIKESVKLWAMAPEEKAR